MRRRLVEVVKWGYDIFRRDRPNGYKGGVIIIFRHNAPAAPIAQSAENNLEYIAIKVYLQGEELFITVTDPLLPDWTSTRTIDLQPKKHLLVGDFNGRSPVWGYGDSDSRSAEIQDWLVDNEFVLTNHPSGKLSCYSRAWKKTSTPDLAMAIGDVQKCDTRGVTDQLGGSEFDPVNICILGAKTNDEYFRQRELGIQNSRLNQIPTPIIEPRWFQPVTEHQPKSKTGHQNRSSCWQEIRPQSLQERS